MTLRKNISLSEEYLQKLEPLLEKHKGNLSATIREVIDLADAALQDPDSVKRLISGLKKEQNLTSATLIWSLKNLAGRLPDEEMVDNIIGKNIFSVSSLQKYMNELGGEIYWGTNVKTESDDDFKPKRTLFTITGKNQDINRFLASIIAVFSMKQFNLGVLKMFDSNGSLNMEMIRGEPEWIVRSLKQHLGYMDSAVSELYAKPEFWNVLTKLYEKMDYKMVAISKKFFDDLLAGGKLPKMTACFERYYGTHISSIHPGNFIQKLYPLYSSMGLIDLIDIDEDSLSLHHGLTEPNGIKKLADLFVELFRLNGQAYHPEVNENLIILKRIPEENEFHKTPDDQSREEESNGEFYSQILDTLPVLIPFDEDIIKSLGSDFGKTTIQNYEKEKTIGNWDTNSFVDFLQYMVKRNELEIKWETVNGNLISGDIIMCPAKDTSGTVDNTKCAFIKGMFDSCIAFAFGEQPEVVHDSRTDKDGTVCNIYIALVNEK